jgi:hypothetical protein
MTMMRARQVYTFFFAFVFCSSFSTTSYRSIGEVEARVNNNNNWSQQRDLGAVREEGKREREEEKNALFLVTTKDGPKCKKCLEFLKNATDKIEKKSTREKLFEAVNEMCERVFVGEDQDNKRAECEALGKEYLEKALKYVKTHAADEDRQVCEQLKLCDEEEEEREEEEKEEKEENVVKIEETFLSLFFAKAFGFLAPQHISTNNNDSFCTFCEFGSSRLAMELQNEDVKNEAREAFLTACESQGFSNDDCTKIADEYEAKFYDAFENFLNDGEMCSDIFDC